MTHAELFEQAEATVKKYAEEWANCDTVLSFLYYTLQDFSHTTTLDSGLSALKKNSESLVAALQDEVITTRLNQILPDNSLAAYADSLQRLFDDWTGEDYAEVILGKITAFQMRWHKEDFDGKGEVLRGLIRKYNTLLEKGSATD